MDYNRQRDKTTEQQARECKAYLQVEEERAKARQKASGGDRRSEEYKQKSVEANLPQPKREKSRAPQSRDFAAAKAGLKPTTARKALPVVDVIDKLKERGRNEEAKELTDTLNKSVDKAYNLAQNTGLLEKEHPEEPQVQVEIEELILEDGRKAFIRHTPGRTL